MSADTHRVCLVGAGVFSQMHADALRCVPGTELVAVCDIDADRARLLAERNQVEHIFTSVDQAIASGTFDCAHVLVPPDRHVAVARELVEAQINVLVEKPFGVSKAECDELLAAAQTRAVRIGVNHNSLFYPAYLKLRQAVLASSLGPLEHLMIAFNGPGEWLARVIREGRLLWMLERPVNMAYEASVHQFAQVYDLAGPVRDAQSTVSGRHDLSRDRYFFDTWQVSLVCENATAQVLTSYGAYRMFQLVAVCQDGVMIAELEQNRFAAVDRGRWLGTRWGRYEQPLHLARKAAFQELRNGLGNLAREARSVVAPGSRVDPYFIATRDSVASFHHGSSAVQPEVDGRFGSAVVGICDTVTEPLGDPQRARPAARGRRSSGRCDAVLLGGTGAIRASLVEHLASLGMTVRVVSRDVAGLPAIFSKPEVRLLEGDDRDDRVLSDSLNGTRIVVQLSVSPRGTELPRSGGPGERLAQACLRAGVQRLVYASSIASLYLGDPHETVTGSTGTDSRADERGSEAAQAARTEESLLRYAREQSLPVCIVRPGLTFGGAGTPFHPGLGVWRGETHCIGWNRGANPLPLVLAADVAAAIGLAMRADGVTGKSYNLVGDVRLSARECVRQLGQAIRRPLVFHPAHPAQHQARQAARWLLAGRQGPFPSHRAVKSKACLADFDCSDVKLELGWSPLADRAEFIERGFGVYRTPW